MTCEDILDFQLAKDLLNTDIVCMEEIRSGRNSQIYHLQTSSAPFVLKVYFQNDSLQRNRCLDEFRSLSFLWEQGIRNIPKPITFEEKSGRAIYEFIEGTPLNGTPRNDNDIDQATTFLKSLNDLTKIKKSKTLPAASEACFDVESINSQLKNRLFILLESPTKSDNGQKMKSFLNQEYHNATNEIQSWVEKRIWDLDYPRGEELPWSERTLSPSDFGFHNAIARPDGNLVFCDFEYFGWDDPAKLIIDFILHPGMLLSSAQKKHFVNNSLAIYGNPESLRKRSLILYPLWGLKWCLILLNEFVPGDLERRNFASSAETQATQLKKAQTFLATLLSEYPKNPYLK